MLVVSAVAAFMLSFTLVGGMALVKQISYQNKVIGAKKTAVQTLRTNVQSTQNLINSYKAFVTTPQNVLGGNPQGNGSNDGDNAKIVLDALPSKYDFPALATSLEKIMSGQNVKIDNISGNDDEVNQTNQTSPNPVAVPIPFQISATGNYKAIRSLIDDFGRSVRPIQILRFQLGGGAENMTIHLEAQTYYQPSKNFNITKQVMGPKGLIAAPATATTGTTTTTGASK
jgi:hypothetical protein